jgi:hypothetical protein
MAKKKKILKEVRDKIISHRVFKTKVLKEINKTFLINNLSNEAFTVSPALPDPFEFVLTIEILPSITIKSVNVNFVMAKSDNFKVDGTKLICTVKSLVTTFTFLLIIDAEGEPDDITTFNMTCDKAKVFDEDQEIVISGTKRGGFINTEIPLP